MMSDPKRDPLDTALARLPREVQPSRDLWPAIEAELSKPVERVTQLRTRRVSSWRWMQMAAAVLIVVGTAVTTNVLTRRSMQEETETVFDPAPLAQAVPVGYAGYVDARKQLLAAYSHRIATLPPEARAKLEQDLADLRRVSGEIATTLEQHPADPLLQELLVSTYQSELDLLADVGEVTKATSVRTEL